MLKITKLIAQANGVTDQAEIDKLNGVLSQQATAGVTIIEALKGHCPGPASNPVFIDQIVNQMKNSDNAAVTPHSPLMAIIHETVDEPAKEPAEEKK
jgi:hypothetical protein